MAKGDDFGGGLPQGALDKVIGLTTGAGAIPASDAVNVLLAVVQEEHQALFPGPGQTGVFEALEALRVVEQAVEDIKKASTPQNIAKLKNAIVAVGALWKKGPVDSAFYSTT